MKKSNSNPRYSNRANNQTTTESRRILGIKNKTNSTVVNTQSEVQQQTTKKNSFHKVNSCAKIVNSTKSSKLDLLKVQPRQSRLSSNKKMASAPTQDNLNKKNQQLIQQNKTLRQQFCKLQQAHLKDKAKIQLLIGRMTQIKTGKESNGSSNTKQCYEVDCTNKQCGQKKRRLQMELHKERIRVFELEQEKKKWDRSRQDLKVQYRQLLEQIAVLRDKE